VTQLSQTTQQNAAGSEELAATAEQMSGHSAHLQEAMAFFKVSIELPANHGDDARIARKQPKKRAPKSLVAKTEGNLAVAMDSAPVSDFSKF
jgi:methyl-accepting chemotaxis protein